MILLNKILKQIKKLTSYYNIITKLKKTKLFFFIKKIITYYKNNIPTAFQFIELYKIFILAPIEDIRETSESYILKYYEGVKNTSILSSFFLIDITLYFYSNFNLNLYYILWLYLLVIKFIIGVFYTIYFKSKKYPLICLYTYLIPAFWVKNALQTIHYKWNPYIWIFYIINHIVIKKYFKRTNKRDIIYANILRWLQYIPLFICFIVLYYTTVVIAFPTLLLYVTLKLLTELVIRKGNCSFLYEILLNIYNKYWILFIILSIFSIVHYFYLYTIISFLFLLKLIIIFWLLNRLINTIIESKGNCLTFGNGVSCNSLILHYTFKKLIIGLRYYIIPYSS